jgi:hypothetical protein
MSITGVAVARRKAEALVAAARRHGLTIPTRNRRRFAPLDAAAVDPFQGVPAGR